MDPREVRQKKMFARQKMAISMWLWESRHWLATENAQDMWNELSRGGSDMATADARSTNYDDETGSSISWNVRIAVGCLDAPLSSRMEAHSNLEKRTQEESWKQGSMVREGFNQLFAVDFWPTERWTQKNEAEAIHKRGNQVHERAMATRSHRCSDRASGSNWPRRK